MTTDKPLEWPCGEGTWTLRKTNSFHRDSAIYDATAADLIALLEAVPEVMAEVLDGLGCYLDGSNEWRRQRTALQAAEQRAAAAEGERDELRAQANALLNAMANDEQGEATSRAYERLRATVDGHYDRMAEAANGRPAPTPGELPEREGGEVPAVCVCLGESHARSCPRNPAYDVTPQYDEVASGPERAEPCHKCGTREKSLVNDGDDGMGPVVCVDCYDPEWKPTPPTSAAKLQGGYGPVEAFRKELVEALRAGADAAGIFTTGVPLERGLNAIADTLESRGGGKADG